MWNFTLSNFHSREREKENNSTSRPLRVQNKNPIKKKHLVEILKAIQTLGLFWLIMLDTNKIKWELKNTKALNGLGESLALSWGKIISEGNTEREKKEMI